MKGSYLLHATAALANAAFALEAQHQRPLGGDDDVRHSNLNLDQIIAASPLLSFHRDIVEISSISDNEKSVGDFIVDFLASQNLTVEKQLVAPVGDRDRAGERFNIYAYTGQNRFPDVLLTSHIDTVPPFIPYSLHAPNSGSGSTSFDRAELLIAGRGTVDAKGSVAAIVFAALESLQADPAASIGLLLVVGEENSGSGMKHFSSSDLNPTPPSFRAVIFGEPTDLKLVAGHKGGLWFKVVAEGKAAHSGYPWLGESAISEILPVLLHLEGLQNIPPSEGGLLRGDLLGNSTLNIGQIQGGVAGNVVPAHAEATISIRLAAGTPDDTREIVQKAFEDVTGGNAHIRLEFAGRESGAPPQYFDADVEGFEVTTVNYGTDAFSLKINDEGAEKVRRYLYGPGSINVAHGDNEAITVGELEEAVRGYKKLISAAL